MSNRSAVRPLLMTKTADSIRNKINEYRCNNFARVKLMLCTYSKWLELCRSIVSSRQTKKFFLKNRISQLITTNFVVSIIHILRIV